MRRPNGSAAEANRPTVAKKKRGPTRALKKQTKNR